MKTQSLTALGFNEKAAQIYLAALSLGTASVQDIAHKAQLKRPTTYVHIEELLKEGLLEKLPIGKKEYYRAADPKFLKQRATQALADIEQSLPEMQRIRENAQGRPSVRVLEGERGLNEIYELITHANSVRFWSDLSAVEDVFPKPVLAIANAIRENEIRSREIISNTPETLRASKRFAATAGKSYSSRIAQKGSIKNDNAIFGNSVAIFRPHGHNLFVVVIEDETIAETMKTIFDLAWESAEPFI